MIIVHMEASKLKHSAGCTSKSPMSSVLCRGHARPRRPTQQDGKHQRKQRTKLEDVRFLGEEPAASSHQILSGVDSEQHGETPPDATCRNRCFQNCPARTETASWRGFITQPDLIWAELP